MRQLKLFLRHWKFHTVPLNAGLPCICTININLDFNHFSVKTHSMSARRFLALCSENYMSSWLFMVLKLSNHLSFLKIVVASSTVPGCLIFECRYFNEPWKLKLTGPTLFQCFNFNCLLPKLRSVKFCSL